MGFNMHFNIILWTNLLTEGPVQIVVFLPISVFRKKGISNGIQTGRNLRGDIFWNKRNPGDLEWRSRKQQGGHEIGRCAPHPCGPHGAPPTYFFHLYILLYPENIEGATKPLFHRRNLLDP